MARFKVAVPSQPCRRCGGSGEEIDHGAVGADLRRLRRARGLSLRALGARLRLTASYLCDLELGRRQWNAARIARYKEALR